MQVTHKGDGSTTHHPRSLKRKKQSEVFLILVTLLREDGDNRHMPRTMGALEGQLSVSGLANHHPGLGYKCTFSGSPSNLRVTLG